MHTELVQSVPSEHVAPTSHGGHAPPQSVAVSDPFFVLSVHVGGAQTLAVQTWLVQSDGRLQVLPA